MCQIRLAGGVLLLGALMGGCASGRTVTLRVERDAPGGPQPVASAFVQVIPTDASMVPLPVNAHTINEALTAVQVSAVTDDRGTVRLTLDADHPHDVTVSVPMLERASTSPASWRGRLSADGRSLTNETPAQDPSPLHVRIADSR